MNKFATKILKNHNVNCARVTEIITPHGSFLTPAFMPVGTRAAVNCLTAEQLQQAGAQIILGGNTYHMLVSPGMDIIKAAGGMHKFMGWQGPLLTDSGGFQVFSLARNGKICKIDEHGGHFKHPITGRVVHLTPQSSIVAQKIIGADIIMAFDECTPETGGRSRALAALERTHRWLLESKEEHLKHPCSSYGSYQALFGIIQGGSFRDLRDKSAEFVVKQELDGIAIGGEVIGFDMDKTKEIISWVLPLLPPEKTRYSMGVGLEPQNLINAVAAGIDIFDCVAPTRNARHGALYYGLPVKSGDWVEFQKHNNKGRMLIKKALYKTDETPIVEGCDCYTCRNFTRAYLHFLFKEKLPLYATLACIHNVRIMERTCELMREVITTCSYRRKDDV